MEHVKHSIRIDPDRPSGGRLIRPVSDRMDQLGRRRRHLVPIAATGPGPGLLILRVASAHPSLNVDARFSRVAGLARVGSLRPIVGSLTLSVGRLGLVFAGGIAGG